MWNKYGAINNTSKNSINATIDERNEENAELKNSNLIFENRT
jgi:hypothetical protein